MSKIKFFQIAQNNSIDIEYNKGNTVCAADLTITAPRYKVFNSSGCHIDCSIQCATDSGLSIKWNDAIAELKEIILLGFSDCPDGTECDYCNEI